MHEQILRTEMVLGQSALERLQSAHVAVFGLGGVGSYAAEILALHQGGASIAEITRWLRANARIRRDRTCSLWKL